LTRQSTESKERRSGKYRQWIIVSAVAALTGAIIVFRAVLAAPSDLPRPPEQPAEGPGGSSYSSKSVVSSGPFWAHGREGDDNYRYFIYEPSDPRPQRAPVILFGHGHGAAKPVQYQAWMEHMVKKGYIVVWVEYQFRTLPSRYASHALETFRDALNRLQSAGTGSIAPLRLDDGRVATAYVGHSAGAYLLASIAALSRQSSNGLDPPAALVAIEPGDSMFGWKFLPSTDFSRIDARTKVLIVVGDEDDVAHDSAARRLWNGLSQIPEASRAYYRFRSDRHGRPAQLGDHYFPNTSGYKDSAAVDARDFLVTYKFSVAAVNCAIFGTECEFAFGPRSDKQTSMGAWSDGVPVRPLERVDQ
jgi:acetyl esterase/lipase